MLLHSLRLLRRSPGFAAAAILTLALGIGANTAIFSVVRGVLLRPLDYGEADRLVAVFASERAGTEQRNPMSPANYRDIRERSRTDAHRIVDPGDDPRAAGDAGAVQPSRRGAGAGAAVQ